MKTMKKHKQMKETRVQPRGVVPLANGEAALCGTASIAQNVREREQSLQVVGVPATIGAVGVGERLLLIADDHQVTCQDSAVKIDGVTVCTVDDNVVGAHHIGQLIVIVTNGGLVYLGQHGGEWVKLDPAAAVPDLAFRVSTSVSHADLDAYSFAAPYSRWQAPLADADVAVLTKMLRKAWENLHADLAAEGRHTGPMLVRWAVRLIDDSYLWMSAPVRVGDETLANAEFVQVPVEDNGSAFSGTLAASLQLVHYNLSIDVTRDIAAEWLPMVKSVDVLATTEAHLVNDSGSLDYRCVTRTAPQHDYILEMGLPRRTTAAISMELGTSPWRLIASASAASHITSGDFAAASHPSVLTNAQCDYVGALVRAGEIMCSTSASGRLYCCTASGDVIVSVPGNPLVEAHRGRVLGASPMAMSVVTRPLYSGGFGRYPVYVFTDDGIFAIPQSLAGSLGDARLVDRTVIARDVAPVEAGRDIWLVSRHRHLCRLSASRLDVLVRDVECVAMAWCNAHEELWIQRANGYPVVRMASGAMSERTVGVAQFYSDPRHALAVTLSGGLLDLEQETAAAVPVRWLSHPVAVDPLMACSIKRVVWHVMGTTASLILKVKGQRGILSQESDVSVTTVTGQVDQPLAAPTMSLRARTLRLSIDGVAQAGTLFLPALVYWI